MVLLQSQQPKPLYLQLEDDIKQSIRFKEYAVGDKMPNESELCLKYGVSRITVRRAIQGLVDIGLLEKQRGKGTFVATPKHVIIVGGSEGFSQYLKSEGHQSHNQIIEKAYHTANQRQASMLNIGEGDRIVFLKRLIMEEDFPLAIDEMCVSAQRFPTLMDLLEGDFSFYKLTEEKFHLKPGGSNYMLDVTTAKPDEAHLLRCATGDPLFIVRKQLLDEHDCPIHYSKSIIRGDRVTYHFKTGAQGKILSFHSTSSAECT